MSVTVYVKEGDDKRVLSDTLYLNGSPLDLTGATVVCVFRDRSDESVVWRRAASVVAPATSGNVKYELTSTDLAGATTFDQEWEVTTSASAVITFPPNGYNVVVVVGDL